MLEKRTSSTGAVFYTSPLLSARGVRHAFSTRVGGVSNAPFDSLNLGNPSGAAIQDTDVNMRENFRRLNTSIDCDGLERCWVWQVHGGVAWPVRRGQAFENGQKGDALVGDDPQRVLCVRVADCVPVLLASDDGSVVAAVHSGWRGVLAGAAVNALRMLREIAGANDAVAAIGAGIGYDHFEVGPEVLAQFAGAFGNDIPMRRRDDGKGYVDLYSAIRLQLSRGGIEWSRIDSTDRCTFRDADEFFSHRRDRGITGRMAALIAPRSS